MTSRVPISAILIAAVAVPIPVQAQTPMTQAAAAQSAEDSRIVCKSEKRPNSRFEDKTCRTKLQWDQIREQHRRDAEEMINGPKICGGGGNAEGC